MFERLWDEVERLVKSPRTTLALESAQCMREKGRPLRLAVDASIFLFKAKHATESAWEKQSFDGINHAAKAFINNAKDIICDGVEPIYVFDGPGRPRVKRGRPTVTGPGNIFPIPAQVTREDIKKTFELDNVIGVAKNLLNLMGVPIHNAPGEAEAECAAMERAGIVDAILTTDGDALAFGGRCVLRYKGSLSDTTIQKVEAQSLEEVGVTPLDWILLGWLSKGDYGDGLRGCGQQAALSISKEIKATKPQVPQMVQSITNSTRDNKVRMSQLRALGTQLVKFMSAAGKSSIWKTESAFPSFDILGYYVLPVTSSKTSLEQMSNTIWQIQHPKYVELRTATARHFTWYNQDRARQFLHTFCPAMLARELLHGGRQSVDKSGLINSAKTKNTKDKSIVLVNVKYQPLAVVPIEYDKESPNVLRIKEYDAGNKRDPHKPYLTVIPEFLLRWGAPGSLGNDGTESNSRKRKSTQGSGENAKRRKPGNEKDPTVALEPAASTARSVLAERSSNALATTPSRSGSEVEIVDLT